MNNGDSRVYTNEKTETCGFAIGIPHPPIQSGNFSLMTSTGFTQMSIINPSK